jgi:type II secretory ATPase GspE/PulE/Tfp pilus assembly ATPase PilB-like protein
LSGLKKSFLLNDLWVPLGWDRNGVEILVDDPLDLRKIDNMRALIKTKKIVLSIGIKEDIEKYIRGFMGARQADQPQTPDASFENVEAMPDISFEEEQEVEDEGEEYDEANSKVVKLVDHLIVAAHRKDASDIHIEPSSGTKATAIRFRMDGLCHEYMTIPNTMVRGVISRVKIMAGLDIAERRLPQDGKIKFRRKGIPPFEIRVATLPNAGGFEDAVLRILASAGPMKLDDMGMSERNLAIMKRIITTPYGMILVVGPTGSGKTTSLHAALRYINKPEIKIWTAEDPVEITQEGLRQIEVKPKIGLDFARVMRSFLRADPDVIMIGEMRDEETASTAIEASLTGHLVLSTLHTNSAPETVTRLLDMGMNALNFSDAFLGVLGQRLVRRICPMCRGPYHPTREEFDEMVLDYGKEDFARTGIQYGPDLTLYRTVGCDECSGTGYRGRLGIHELLEGTPEIKRMIKRQANTEELFRQGIEDGMTTLRQDGILKVFKGLTDIREVRRVCIK